MFSHVPENQEAVLGLVFHVSEKQHAKFLELIALRSIKFSDVSPSKFIQPFIHQLDDMKMVEYDSSFREMLSLPTGISVGHVHCNDL